MNKFEFRRKTLASSFPAECRIPHLENNTYIYGTGSPDLSPLPIYEPLKFSVSESYQKGLFDIKPYADHKPFKTFKQERSKNKDLNIDLNSNTKPVFNLSSKIPVCSGAHRKFSIENLNTDNKLNSSYNKNPQNPEPRTVIHHSKSCESIKRQGKNLGKNHEKANEPATHNTKTNENSIKFNNKKINETIFEPSHKLARSFSIFSERNSVLAKNFEAGSPIERVSSMNSGSVVNEIKEITAKNDKIGSLVERVPSMNSGSVVNETKDISAKNDNKGKNLFRDVNESGSKLEFNGGDNKNFIVKQNSLKSEGNSGRHMIGSVNSMKSEGNSNRNSYFAGNIAKNQGKLTKGELESMEIHSILRKNGKNTEQSVRSIENQPEIDKEKLDSHKAESERKATQAALIEDFKRESLRRELSRQSSLKAKFQIEDLSTTNKIQTFGRKNSEFLNLSKTAKRKASETFEYSSESSKKNSSKQQIRHSTTNSPSEYLTSSNNPSFSTQKSSDFNRVAKMHKNYSKLSRSCGIYNTKSRRNSLRSKESDHKYHESTFTYKLKYMDNQPYTYLPGAKSHKTLPKFIFKLNHI